MAPPEQATGGAQRRRHVGVIGGVALAALDVGVYLAFTLAARPTGCIAPQVTTPVLDCFWNNLDVSLYRLPWVYVAVSLAVPCLLGALVAARRDSAERGGAERGGVAAGALAGGVVGLLSSSIEVLLIAGIIVYGYVVASVVPGGAGCSVQPRCVDLTRIPAMAPLLLIVLGTIVTEVVLLRLLSGLALGALGGLVGQHVPRAWHAVIRPAHP